MAIKKGEKIMDKEKPIAEEEQAVEKKEAANVHQVIPAGEKGWAVKRMNSTKVIKYFPTKKEALEYVTQVCENQNTKLVVQKKSGAFQKLSNALRGLKKTEKK